VRSGNSHLLPPECCGDYAGSDDGGPEKRGRGFVGFEGGEMRGFACEEVATCAPVPQF